MPLGLLANVTYDRLVVKPQARDLIVLYSDGVSEAASPAGDELGREGLMNMARTLDSSSPKRSALNSPWRSVPFVETESLWMMRRSS